ncbi:hypothetical protein CDD82_7883 [Ophiocordyceps australis]|uniref:Uncharacterized protein n=1 Tax=Ophiocordyceps australis TaxID=1399860 RepID=A0A2C5ZL41_9HYPO|nr:hypothetical protein CDD82_7883 [Ophiocordyceps australis]
MGDTQELDFEGQVATSNALPSSETVESVKDYILLDKHGKSHPFWSLYSGRHVARRMLVIFVRHFFCGNCQEFLRSLAESVTPDALLRLPISTFVVVIGCGDPALISMYTDATQCPFPIYTDPNHALFDALGMIKTLNLGDRPAYQRRSMVTGIVASIGQALRYVPAGLALRSGDQRQVGGEFLFEPMDPVTPLDMADDEADCGLAGVETKGEPIETKRVTWCHRMRTTRDHAEIPELMEVLGLDGQGEPIKDGKRWSKALNTRKGTGFTMANQMRRISETNMENAAIASADEA